MRAVVRHVAADICELFFHAGHAIAEIIKLAALLIKRTADSMQVLQN